ARRSVASTRASPWARSSTGARRSLQHRPSREAFQLSRVRRMASRCSLPVPSRAAPIASFSRGSRAHTTITGRRHFLQEDRGEPAEVVDFIAMDNWRLATRKHASEAHLRPEKAPWRTRDRHPYAQVHLLPSTHPTPSYGNSSRFRRPHLRPFVDPVHKYWASEVIAAARALVHFPKTPLVTSPPAEGPDMASQEHRHEHL